MTWSIYIQPALLQSRGFARGRGWMGWVLPVCHTSQRFHPWAAHSQLSYTVGISKGTWKLDSGSHQLALVQVFTPPCWVREQQKVWSQLSVCSELLKILNIHSSISVSTTPIKNDLRIKETAMLFSVTWLDFAAPRFSYSLFKNIFINNIMPGVSWFISGEGKCIRMK